MILSILLIAFFGYIALAVGLSAMNAIINQPQYLIVITVILTIILIASSKSN